MHTAGLEGLIKGSELPGGGRGGLRQGLVLRLVAKEGADVLNININKIKDKVSTWEKEKTNGKQGQQLQMSKAWCPENGSQPGLSGDGLELKGSTPDHPALLSHVYPPYRPHSKDEKWAQWLVHLPDSKVLPMCQAEVVARKAFQPARGYLYPTPCSPAHWLALGPLPTQMEPWACPAA